MRKIRRKEKEEMIKSLEQISLELGGLAGVLGVMTQAFQDGQDTPTVAEVFSALFWLSDQIHRLEGELDRTIKEQLSETHNLKEPK